MIALKALTILSACICSAYAAPRINISPRACPSFTTKPDFEVKPYLGEWFEQKAFPAPFQDHYSCVRARYTLMNDGNVEVYNVGTTLEGELDFITGYAYQPHPDTEPGMLTVVFGGLPLGQYAVLDTDYENFSAVYSCQGIGPLYIEFAWILTRERNASNETVSMAIEQYEKFGIDITQFYDTVQNEDCIYDP